MKTIALETISMHTNLKKVIGSSQHGLRKGVSCQNNLRAFCNEMMSLVDEGRLVDIVYFDLNMVFDTVSCNTLIGKLMKYWVGK